MRSLPSFRLPDRSKTLRRNNISNASDKIPTVKHKTIINLELKPRNAFEIVIFLIFFEISNHV